MITENLIDRLNAKTAQHMIEKVRDGRRRALSSISKCCTITDCTSHSVSQRVLCVV